MQVKEVCRDEYLPMVDADIRKTEQEFQRYVNNTVSMCHAFEKRAVAAERQNAALRKSLESENKKLQVSRTKCSMLQKEVSALRVSESYRVGLFVTWPARKAWGGVKCLRENGVKYTVKHAAGKVLRKFGAKCRW